ncbi:YhcH/YjgK/YiaL family protein [bacterium]|nr:YhcH/YjgK/YiaL family protein [bacterium]
MIVDCLKNAEIYYNIDEDIKVALQFLAKNDFEDAEIGRYEFKNGIYIMVQEYKTKPVQEGFWEAHRQYIDVQYIVRGIERIGYANVNNLKISQEYMKDKDYLVLSGKGDFFTACTGTFVIFYPEDAHMPCLTAKKPQIVKKVVIKIPVKERREKRW